MGLPQFKDVETSKYHPEPIYKSLYELKLYNFDGPYKMEMQYAEDNIFEYHLMKNIIVVQMNMNEELGIQTLCDMFSTLDRIAIDIHNPKGDTMRRLLLQMEENCLDNFSFGQNWNETTQLVTFTALLKYKEIVSEQIIK